MPAEPTLRYPCCKHCGVFCSRLPGHREPCGQSGCPGRIPFELEMEG